MGFLKINSTAPYKLALSNSNTSKLLLSGKVKPVYTITIDQFNGEYAPVQFSNAISQVGNTWTFDIGTIANAYINDASVIGGPYVIQFKDVSPNDGFWSVTDNSTTLNIDTTENKQYSIKLRVQNKRLIFIEAEDTYNTGYDIYSWLGDASIYPYYGVSYVAPSGKIGNSEWVLDVLDTSMLTSLSGQFNYTLTNSILDLNNIQPTSLISIIGTSDNRSDIISPIDHQAPSNWSLEYYDPSTFETIQVPIVTDLYMKFGVDKMLSRINVLHDATTGFNFGGYGMVYGPESSTSTTYTGYIWDGTRTINSWTLYHSIYDTKNHIIEIDVSNNELFSCLGSTSGFEVTTSSQQPKIENYEASVGVRKVL